VTEKTKLKVVQPATAQTPTQTMTNDMVTWGACAGPARWLQDQNAKYTTAASLHLALHMWYLCG